MDCYSFRNTIFHVEDMNIKEISETVGTPVYVYSRTQLKKQFLNFRDDLKSRLKVPFRICYALKANSNLAVISTLAEMGCGADIVSEGELLRALRSHVPSKNIVFSGVGKTSGEITAALANNIACFNVESQSELETINTIAIEMGVKAPVALRLNPDIDAKTHEKISTGKKDTKFGIFISDYLECFRYAASLTGIHLIGVDAHIGSQITCIDPFNKAFVRISEVIRTLKSEGYDLSYLNLGGGLGIAYLNGEGFIPCQDYAALVQEIFGGFDCFITFEPGRRLVADCGIMISKVLHIKSHDDKKFLIIDAGMNDFLRPAMYAADHNIMLAQQSNIDTPKEIYDIVGPVCETSDTFAKNYALPSCCQGDLLIFNSVGAYSAVMASEYNTRPLIPEVMVQNNTFAIIRNRPSYDEILDRDIIPQWADYES
jgi:diaminopimelate decarboxylase